MFPLNISYPQKDPFTFNTPPLCRIFSVSQSSFFPLTHGEELKKHKLVKTNTEVKIGGVSAKNLF